MKLLTVEMFEAAQVLVDKRRAVQKVLDLLGSPDSYQSDNPVSIIDNRIRGSQEYPHVVLAVTPEIKESFTAGLNNVVGDLTARLNILGVA